MFFLRYSGHFDRLFYRKDFDTFNSPVFSGIGRCFAFGSFGLFSGVSATCPEGLTGY